MRILRRFSGNCADGQLVLNISKGMPDQEMFAQLNTLVRP